MPFLAKYFIQKRHESAIRGEQIVPVSQGIKKWMAGNALK
jgi:hypothetical protein